MIKTQKFLNSPSVSLSFLKPPTFKKALLGGVVALNVGLMSGCLSDSNDNDSAKVWSQSELVELTATQAAEQIKSGQLTSVELTRALINQAKAYDYLNAFITLNETKALARAAELDAAYDAGSTTGALFGVPVIFKDNIHVAGIKNTAGTPGLSDFIPSENALVVQALLDEGAIALGKTNMHELALGITSDNAAYGAVGNPYNPANTAGGSSGGNGAAIAARMAPIALGTDTGGSVRIPAALNGIFSLRPTMGRYAQEGVTPISHTRDTVGPMARSVSDLVLLDGLIANDNTPVTAPSLNELRIGIPRAYFYENLDPEVSAAMEAVLDNLRQSGVTLVEADLEGVAELTNNIGFPVVIYETVQDLNGYLSEYNTGVTFEQLAAQTSSPDVAGLFASLTTLDDNNDGIADGLVPEQVYQDAMTIHRPALQALFQAYYDDNNLDGILIPTTPLPSRPTEGLLAGVELNGETVNTFGTYIRNTDPDSNAGLPGVALPIALTSDGLPIGIQLGGPANSDRRLLGIALSIEAKLETLPAPAGY